MIQEREVHTCVGLNVMSFLLVGARKQTRTAEVNMKVDGAANIW
jgi:hypothetical protein